MAWFIPTALAAGSVGTFPKAVDACKSFFNFLSLPCKSGGGGATNENSSVYGLITRIITFFLQISATVTVALMVYAGFLLITASADPEQAKKAKSILTWATIGLVVVLTAFMITSAVKGLIYGIKFNG